MPVSRVRFAITVMICMLMVVMAAGCVRAKPEREREPLPKLPPVEVAALENELPSLESEGEVGPESVAEEAEAPAEGDVTLPADEQPVPTVEPTDAPTPTPEPTPYTGPLYTVLPGETLGTIAAAHGSTVEAFVEANDLSNTALRVGQQLRLPSGVEPLWETDVENTAIHVVQAGEILNDISSRYRMPVGQIMALNPWLTNPNLLRPGDQVTVVVEPVDPDALVHVVQAGETLASIALQYGVSVSELADANYIVDASRIAVGQELIIP